MSSKELDNLVRVGLLKKEPGDQGEFNGLVKSGRARLNDAKTPGFRRKAVSTSPTMQRTPLRSRHCAGTAFGRTTSATSFSKVSSTL
jgi:hypothetical protein